MRVTDWNKITISAKEFLAGIVFAISMSGVYYKMYFQAGERERVEDARYQEFVDYKKEHAELSGKKIVEYDSRFRALEDDNLRRKILDEGHSSNGYEPMKRAK